MSKTSTNILSKGYTYLTASHNTTCTLADTYYKIDGTWVDCDCNYFTADGTGKFTCNKSGEYLFNGVSDVAVDTAGLMYYALYLNGVLVPIAQTPHDFTAAAKTEGIAITSIISLNVGDYIEVYAKHETVGTIITTSTLFLTFFGDR